ncbi:hypothetical protein K2P97_09130 [bacterium]|nr:hypothetical protein [bacterium]
MKIIVTLTILLIASFAQAAVLLIPTEDINPNTYLDWCSRENYTCTTDVFVNDIKNKPALQFNQLMNQVDLGSTQFLEQFRNSIVTILNTEDLNLSQLDMLLDLMGEINKKHASLLFKMIENELLRARDLIQNSQDFDKSEFVLIFKKPVPPDTVRKLRTSIIKIPLYLISYAGVPVKSDSVNFNRIIRKPLIKGSCGNYKLNLNLNHISWILLKPEGCRKKDSFVKPDRNDFSFTKEARH